MKRDRLIEKKLVDAAVEARERAYAPYSGFSVGAALLTAAGMVYTGCNIENAAFTPGCCAERAAFFRAVSEGERNFAAIAVAGGKTGEPIVSVCPPCGVCRQVMQEFCDPERFLILLPGSPEQWEIHTLKELLPLGFSGRGTV